MHNTHFFIHGLESSGKGTKGRFFTENYPFVQCPDFTGSLEERLRKLTRICEDHTDLTLIGSSFGGLMATCYAIEHPQQVAHLILLAPAFNFSGYAPPSHKLAVKTLLLIGDCDEVTPIDPVVSLAEETFTNLTVKIVSDDHFLHKTFTQLDWPTLLSNP